MGTLGITMESPRGPSKNVDEDLKSLLETPRFLLETQGFAEEAETRWWVGRHHVSGRQKISPSMALGL
jgi:hypothetical protein